MAKKISELTAITTIADDDLTPIVDTSETETKKMTASQMKTYAQGDLNTRLTTVETNGIIGATQYGGTIVTNLNTISKGGFYTALGTATGVPNSSYSWFITHQNSNTGTISATQRVVAFSTNSIIYERTKINGTWGAWINRITVNNLTTAAAGNGVLDAYQGKVLNDKITNLKTYSTSEIDTGEIWDDGKHIFRRTIKSTTPSAIYTWATLTSGLNADVIFKYYGYFIFSSSETKILPYTHVDQVSNNNTSFWFQKNSSNEFQVATNDSDNLSKTLSVTIEYTKKS